MRSFLPLFALAALAQGNDGFTLPPLVYHPIHSVRGAELGNFELSSSATILPGVHDFFRLLPQTPLAFGGAWGTEKWTDSTEFVVEIAFRVHGAIVSSHETEHKGGRGLAFWYTKVHSLSHSLSEQNIDIPSLSSQKKTSYPPTYTSKSPIAQQPPPHAFPAPNDDTSASLFGHATSFEGLAVIFDSSPSSPLFPRSDTRNLISNELHGAEQSGVVSAILDDNSHTWLDQDTIQQRKIKNAVFGGTPLDRGGAEEPRDEADYLTHSIGECEAAFRNAQGLLWARIVAFNGTIRVDLDLTPHTNLATGSRSYQHNCFSMDGIELEKGYYFGLSALASGNTEPDAVDIYALDVWSIAHKGESVDHQGEVEATAQKLEGTTDDPVINLTHELFLSQEKMMAAIDSLGRRVEVLTRNMLLKSAGSSATSPSDAQYVHPSISYPVLY